MNNRSKPNNSDPSDSEHPSASRSTTTRKKAPKRGKKKYKVHTTVLKKIITDFYSTYRKMAAQRAAEADAAASSAHLTPYILYFFYRSEQILEASHLTVAPLLHCQMSPSAPNPGKHPLPFLQYSKQILTTTPITTITMTITTTTTTITTTTTMTITTTTTTITTTSPKPH